MSASSKAQCPYCGSTDKVIHKGTRDNKHASVRLFFCKSCHKRYSENRVKMRELPDDTAEIYLLNATSLDSVLKTKKLGLSRTTLHRRIIEQARKCLDWDELLKTTKGQGDWGPVLGIDTSGLRIKGKNHVYLHVADVTSHTPLAYAVCKNEDAATVEPILRQLRILGYRPRVVVSDLAPELLSSIKRIFPCAVIQGCIFHVRLWLEKELPTRKTSKKFGEEKMALWRKVKEFINCACISKNEDTREQFLKKLQCLNLDEKAKNVVELFSANLKYYHTMDEDEFKEYGPNILYNNVCERHIGLIKDLKNKMKGFKSIDCARNIIKLYWFHKRKNPTSLPETEEHISSRGHSSYNVPLPYYFDSANLDLFSKVSGVPREVLNKTAQEMGRTVVGDFAFTETELKDIQNSILNMREKSLRALMQEIRCDQSTTVELLHKFGFNVQFKSFDPSGMIISS